MIRRFFLLCLAVVASVPALRGDAAQPPAASLLSDGTPNLQADTLDGILGRTDTVQGRATVLNLAALEADLVDVAVTSGRTLRARLDRRVANPYGSESWSGQIVGEPLSAATFVRSGASGLSTLSERPQG